MSDPTRIRMSWRRGVLLGLALIPGCCEILVTTPGFDPAILPLWLATTVAMVGFLTFLVLTGLTSFVGNLVVAVLLAALLRHRWRWPLWLSALAAAPYWLAFLRIVPRPW